jgi:hypothetical protein
MIGKSWPEYVFIVTCIAGLRSIAPVSVAYLIACLPKGRFLFSPWLGAYAIAEASFFTLVYVPRYFLSQRVSSAPIWTSLSLLTHVTSRLYTLHP